MMMRNLSLTSQQKDDIKQIRKETKQDLSVFAAEQALSRSSMRAIMQAEVWDEDAVRASIEQQMTLNLQRKLIQAKSKNKVFNQLSSEQQTIFIANDDAKSAKGRAGQGNMKKGKHKRDSSPEKRMQRLAKSLDLNAEQQAQLSKMMQSNMAQRAANQAFAQNDRAQLKSIIQAKEFDESAWLALHEQNKQEKLTMAISKAKSRFDMMSVLNTEQREKFAKIMQKSKVKKHKNRGKRKNRSDDQES